MRQHERLELPVADVDVQLSFGDRQLQRRTEIELLGQRGHEPAIDFDDRPGAERIHLKTQGGHHLEMKDADGTIEIKTKGGQQILMSDQPEQIKLKTSSGTEVTLDGTPSTVTAKTAGGVSLKASDAGGVTVDSMTGEVKINCLSATVNASSSITVNAATMTLNAASVSVNSGIATFAGVVQCTTLIASSVVSSSYTPGAGNIW